MRLIGINSLKAGDILAMPVCTSNGRVILNSGITITDNYIEKLKQIGIKNIYIEDERFNDIEIVPALDLKTINKALKVLSDTYEAINNSNRIDEYLIQDVSKGIVDYIRDNKDKGVSILAGAVEDYITGHSLNVAILTAFMGNKMNYNYNQLRDLVTGALIHDMGRVNIREERPEHAQQGFDVMRRYRGISLHASIVCYEHHENFNGTGYPRKIKGTAISEFSRVVRVADLYDIALHGYEQDNNSIMPHQAYEHILAAAGSILDPALVEIFRDTVVFYPNGCTVQLSNGLKGVVIRQNAGSPQRPVIRVFNDVQVIGEIDMVKSLTLSIKDVVVA